MINRIEELKAATLPPSDREGSRQAFEEQSKIEAGKGDKKFWKKEKKKPEPSVQEKPEEDKEWTMLDMDTFYSQCEEIKKNNQLIKRAQGEIETRHKQALASASVEESAGASREVAALTQTVNQLIAKNRSLVLSMKTRNEELVNMVPLGSANMRQRVINQKQLGQAFLRTSKEFERMQAGYKEKYVAQVQRQYKIVNPEASKAELDALAQQMDASGGLSDASKQQIFAMAVKEDAKRELAKMKNRMDDMLTIERNLQALAELFFEMQELVVSQNDTINRIGYNVENTADYLGEAKTSLQSAVQSQKAIQKKKWLMLLIALVVVIVIVISVYSYFGRRYERYY